MLVEAERAGATIGRPGAPTFWGGYSGVFVDPDGHPWEVAHNPRWTLAEDGSVSLEQGALGEPCVVAQGCGGRRSADPS